MEYHIYYILNDLLNLYSDSGNVKIMEAYAKELDLEPIVHYIDDIKDIDFKKADFMMIGGGNDNQTLQAVEILKPIKKELKEAVENGLSLLAINSGYEMLGQSSTYEDKVEMLGVFDYETIKLEERVVGNTVLDSDSFDLIIGFSNHANQIKHSGVYLGKVIAKQEDTLSSTKEGFIYKNVIATNLHGPLLVKNPDLVKFFFNNFAQQKEIELSFDKIDFTFENKARDVLLKRFI
ncbi:MAG: hypothetical protein RR543_03525 [Erysipelotrichales bacterium]